MKTELIEQIQSAFFDIPFDNSAYQNEAFVVASQITPGRAYRAVGLRLTAKLRALNDALFSQRRLEVDLLELDEKLGDPSLNRFERMRLEIDREEKLSHQWLTRKLVRDAEVEVETLTGLFQAMPKLSRDQFEAGEQSHFTERLLRQASGLGGAAESLMNMSDDHPALKSGTLGTLNLSLTTKVLPATLKGSE